MQNTSMPSKDSEVRTCDLYLAACLVTLGVRYHTTSVVSSRVYFHFKNEDGAVDKAKGDYLSRALPVDALTYSDTINSLKSFSADLLRRK